MMKSNNGPINQQALIAFGYKHKAFEQAGNLATKLYKKQKREFMGVNYLSHPLTVCSLLLEFTAEASTLVAAMLAETLVRTNLREASIEEQFGPVVLTKVKALTPGWGLNETPTAEQVQAYGAQLKACGSDVQNILVASMLEKTCAIPSSKLSAMASQLLVFKELATYLTLANSALRTRLDFALKRALA